MAGEAGHVVYGARVLAYLGEAVQSPAYWAGTLFPDIRHLGVVSRHRTHPDNVSLTTLAGKNDFYTGLRVHAWIDFTREDWLKKRHVKEELFWHPFVPHALKLVEDELVYERFDDWNLIQRVLQDVSDDELSFVADTHTVHRWHTILQNYLAEAPTDASQRRLSLDIGLSEKSADEITMVVHKLKEQKATHEVLNDFIAHLDTLLE